MLGLLLMAHRYRLDVLFTADDPGDEGGLADDVERALEAIGIEIRDLTVYEVGNMPSYAEQEREARRAKWKPLPL